MHWYYQKEQHLYRSERRNNKCNTRASVALLNNIKVITDNMRVVKILHIMEKKQYMKTLYDALQFREISWHMKLLQNSISSAWLYQYVHITVINEAHFSGKI